MVSGDTDTTEVTHFPDSRIVQLNSGPIIGRRLIHEGEKKVDGFQGIPYAKPPIGELRFRKSVLPEPWTDVKETKKFGARSMQFEYLPERSIGQGPVSEDCLFLNVFTPVWEPQNSAGFPVLVFIHGGGYHSGSPVRNGDVTIAENLVKKDVIVITVHYRLGFLGFFTTGDENCRGNWGLWDLNLALDWIQDNIPQFNGDPSNVTLIGQSAGAALVDFLRLSPYSRDKFHKIILLSGSSQCELWPMIPNGVEKSRAKAERLGIEETDSKTILEKLRSLPAEAFSHPDDLPIPSVENFCITPITPVIDGNFLPKSLEELRREAAPKSKIIGCCMSEGIMFYMFLKMRGTSSLELIDRHINCLFDKVTASCNDAENKYRELLLGSCPEELSQNQLEEALVQIIGDRFESTGIQKDVIESVVDDKADTYLFSFDYSRPEHLGHLKDYPCAGPTHAQDMAFIFGVAGIIPFEYNNEDRQMLRIHSTYLTNFVKFGNPNALVTEDIATTWQPATADHPQRHLKIDLPPTMNDVFLNGRPVVHAVYKRSHDAE